MLLLLLLVSLLLSKKFVKMELIYVEPVYNLQFPNFTLGGLFGITKKDGIVNSDGIDRAIAMMCTLKEFNNGNGPFSVGGVFNGLIYDAGGTLKQSEYAAMKLLEYNLKGDNLDSTNSVDSGIKVGAVIADLDTDIFFATQPIFTGFPFTFLGVQYLNTGIIGNNSTLLPRPVFKARLVPQSFVISAAASSYMAESIIKMLVYFNWTLVTVIYSRDTFGMEGQAFLQPLLQQNSISTTCEIITQTSQDENKELDTLVNCLNQSDSKVVIVWSGTDSRILIQFCNTLQSKTDSKLIFITPGSNTNEYIKPSELSPISPSFLFKNVNFVPKTESFVNCLKTIKPETQEYFDSNLFREYWEEKFKCPTVECEKESIIEFTQDLNQVSDSTMLILKSIYLMQKYCSTLNDLLNTYDLNLQNKNYCEKNEFTAADIYQIVNLVLYLGLPEFLSLGNNSSSPSSVPSLHSLQIIQINQNGQLVPVGNYSDNQIKINNDLLYWEDDVIPKSEVSIDNPTLNNAIVDVFFSLAILGIVLSFTIKFFLIFYRNDRIIRKSSPWSNFQILIGIDLILIGFIFYGMTYTTTTCFLYTWLLVLGIGLCLSSIAGKSYRIYRIFKNKEATAISISNVNLIYFSFIILICEIVLLAIYSFSSGLLGPVVIQSSNDLYYKYRTCLVPSTLVQIGLLILIYTFNNLILLSIAFLAFLTRKIDNSFSEAQSIAYITYCTLLFQIIFLPLLYTLTDSTGNAQTRYAVTGIIILCTSYLAMILLFFKKIKLILIK